MAIKVIPESLERYVSLITIIKLLELFAELLILSIKEKTNCSRKDRTEGTI
jgi:hypothetical protein